MPDFETTRDVLATLTSHEKKVLQERFGIEQPKIGTQDDSAMPPPNSGEDDGSGGSAPATVSID